MFSRLGPLKSFKHLLISKSVLCQLGVPLGLGGAVGSTSKTEKVRCSGSDRRIFHIRVFRMDPLFLEKELFDSGSKHLNCPIQNVICNVICRAGAGPDPRNYIFSRGPGRKEKWNERDMLLLNDVC